MTLFDLVAKLTLDSSEYDQGLDGARGKANKFANGLNSAADKVLKVGAAAAGAAVAGMTAFAKSAVSTGQQFDAAMSQVAATMGVSVDSIQDLRDYAQKMGAETAFSANEAAQALNYMALAGYDAETSMKMLPNVLNLAAAGGMDLALASDMITDSQSALGLSLEETSSLVDKMAQAASKSNTSVSQLGDAILTVGGTAKSLKGGTTELATALGILADNGVKGAEGGTALRNIILSLTAPTDNAAATMSALGVSVFDAEGNMRSLNDVFGDLNRSLSTLTQEQRVSAISEIFNSRDLKSAEALLANVGGRWNELSGYIDDASGAAQKMADTQLDNLTGDITLMNSALEGAKIAFSDGITPAIRDVVKMITRALSHPKSQAYLKDVGKKLGEIIKVIANGAKNAIPRLLSLFDNGAKKLKIITAAVAGFVLAVKSTVNPLGALISGLGLLAGAMTLSALTADNSKKYYGGLTEAQLDNRDAVNESIDAYGELNKSRAASYAAADKEIDQLESLWKELQTLADENGYVTDANRDRANFIINELNSALGTEYAMNGNIIGQYREMGQEVDNLIKKKRANVYIDLGEERYRTAVENLPGLQDAISDTQNEIDALEKKRDELLEERSGYQRTAVNSNGAVAYYNPSTKDWMTDKEWNALSESIDNVTESLSNANAELETLTQQESQYYHDIGLQERAYVLESEGRYDELAELYENDTTNRWRHLQETRGISKEELGELRRDTQIALRNVERYRRNLLAGMAGYTEEGLRELENDANSLLAVYNSTAQGFMRESASLRESLFQSGKEIAGYFMGGLKIGIENYQGAVYNTISSVASSSAQALRNGLAIKSPSRVTRQIGQYFTEGFELGIMDEADNAIKAAEDMALTAADATYVEPSPLVGRSVAAPGDGAALSTIVELLREILANMGFDVVLNDGVLAGRIDKLLGKSALRKARGSA